MPRLAVLFTVALALCAPPLLSAQSSLGPDDSKAEVFGGYSNYRAGGKVNGVTVPDFTTGWAGQFILNASHWVGVVADLNGHYNSFGTAYDLAGGVRGRMPLRRFTPFGEAMLGVQHFSPKGLASHNAPTYIVGAGLDVKLTPRISLRPLELSFVNSFYNPQRTSTSSPGTDNFDGVRVQAGLIYNFGLPSGSGPVQAVCGAEPSIIDAGESIKVTVAARGFGPHHQLSYSYGTTGGKIVGNLADASVDTTGVPPGNYAIKARVVDDVKGKHQRAASCEAPFHVRAQLPPTLFVSADPTSIPPGGSSTITAKGNSSDHRPLSYSCSSDGGHLIGEGPTYTLDTKGASAGTINVKCSVSDDRNLTASARTTVEIATPKDESHPPVAERKAEATKTPVAEQKAETSQPTVPERKPESSQPPVAARKAKTSQTPAERKAETPHASVRKGEASRVHRGEVPPAAKFGTIDFLRDAKRPTRVDNQAKGELDRLADALAATPDAKAVLVGFASVAESKDEKSLGFAAQRAVNTKDYLARDKGVDPARVQPRASRSHGKKVELWIVQPGSTFPSKGSTGVDESKVKAVPRVALKARTHKETKKPTKKKT